MRAETPFAAVLPEGVSLVTMHFFRASSMILPKPSFTSLHYQDNCRQRPGRKVNWKRNATIVSYSPYPRRAI